MGVIVVEDDGQFQSQLSNNGTNLVVVDFTASWCGPCRRIAPVFEQMVSNFPKAVFLKVDVDVCLETAHAQGVTAMPTFMFFRNKARVDRMTGADPKLLEEKIRHWYGSESDKSEKSEQKIPGAQSQIDLTPFIMMKECEVLNACEGHGLSNCLQADDEFLISECDNQLIISLGFTQAVKIHSIKIKAPATNGPKAVKLFINQPNTLDFDKASANIPTQVIEVDPNDLAAENPIELQYVKFQNVQNIQLFVQDNHDGSDATRIDRLQLIGSPVPTTSMKDFKRVSGKKGETHFR